jgi:hypothetical protein
MAFRLAQKPTFKVEVTVPVPNDKGGHDKNKFVAVFKRTTTDEARAFFESQVTNEDLIRDRMVDWELVDAETNEAVPFSRDNLEALLQIAPSPKFIAQAFFEQVGGGKHRT